MQRRAILHWMEDHALADPIFEEMHAEADRFRVITMADLEDALGRVVEAAQAGGIADEGIAEMLDAQLASLCL